MGQSTLDSPSLKEGMNHISFENDESILNNSSFFEKENPSFNDEKYINNILREQNIGINKKPSNVKSEKVNDFYFLSNKTNQKVTSISQKNTNNYQTTKVKKNNTNNINETNISNNSNNNNNQNNTFISKKRKFTETNEEPFVLDKYIKKIRTMILNKLFIFINLLIKDAYNNKIGQGICKKQLLPIKKNNLSHSCVEDDKDILNKTLKEIFSSISERYTFCLKTHNEELIDELRNSQNKGNYFQELFDLSFLDCIQHIRGTKNLELLDGLPKIEQILKDEKKNWKKLDLDNIKKVFKDYEDLVRERISREKRSKKNKS